MVLGTDCTNSMTCPALGREVLWSARYTARRILLRSTAVLATFFETTTAQQKGVEVGSTFAERTCPRPPLPRASTSRTSAVLSRRALESIGDYTVTRARPLRRRRTRVLRPPALLLRFKNPCERARLRFFGWYVCDICQIYSIPSFSTTCTQKTVF